MNEKLTLQDCCKYPNALIRYQMNQFPVSFLEFIEDEYIENDYRKRPFDYIHDTLEKSQLILRPLSSLTEEEKNELWKFTTDDKLIFEYQYDESTKSLYADYYTPDIYSCHKEVIDYLRGINIDIDGFLANGKAVQK